MAKKITLEVLAKLVTDLGTDMDKSFAKQGKEIGDLGESIARVVKHMATKKTSLKSAGRWRPRTKYIALHTQVTSIGTQLRDMRHVKLQSRVADLEEEDFGKARG